MDNIKQKNIAKEWTSKKLSKSRKTKVNNDTKEESGVNYPLDIWFIISEYIKPESVGKFACICRNSYYVTTTAKFWFHLYKSYYRFVPGLPERLQPQCMVRPHGLRACVIRTLHYTYFAPRRESNYISHLQQEEPHSLVKRRCCLMWHKKGKIRWRYYFTLKEVSKTSNNQLTKKSRDEENEETDFLEILEDININPENGCKLLCVSCLNYCMLPLVNGLILQKVSITLMPGFKHHRLQLGFGTSNVPSTLRDQIILNDVTDYQVLDWWRPHYPHQDADFTINLVPSNSWD